MIHTENKYAIKKVHKQKIILFIDEIEKFISDLLHRFAGEMIIDKTVNAFLSKVSSNQWMVKDLQNNQVQPLKLLHS